MRIDLPKDGDTRYITKFLFKPERFDGSIRFLEKVTIRQGYFYHGMIQPGWSNICLSNPLTGSPESFEVYSYTPLLRNPMTEIGVYPNINKDSHIKKV